MCFRSLLSSTASSCWRFCVGDTSFSSHAALKLGYCRPSFSVSQLIWPLVIRLCIINLNLSLLIYATCSIYSLCFKDTLPGGPTWLSETGNSSSQPGTDKKHSFSALKLCGRGIRWLNFLENVLPKSVWMESFAVKIQCYSEPLCSLNWKALTLTLKRDCLWAHQQTAFYSVLYC